MSIINSGVLSSDLAKRAKISLPFGTGGFQGARRISIFDSHTLSGIGGLPSRNALLRAKGGKEAIVYSAVSEHKIEAPDHYGASAIESVVLRRINPKSFLAVKLPKDIEPEKQWEIIEAAKQRKLPVYDSEGHRVWPPIKKGE